jgi:hypothetical protein
VPVCAFSAHPNVLREAGGPPGAPIHKNLKVSGGFRCRPEIAPTRRSFAYRQLFGLSHLTVTGALSWPASIEREFTGGWPTLSRWYNSHILSWGAPSLSALFADRAGAPSNFRSGSGVFDPTLSSKRGATRVGHPVCLLRRVAQTTTSARREIYTSAAPFKRPVVGRLSGDFRRESRREPEVGNCWPPATIPTQGRCASLNGAPDS